MSTRYYPRLDSRLRGVLPTTGSGVAGVTARRSDVLAGASREAFKARIVWTVGRRGSLLGLDQFGNGYRIERQGAAKRRGGVVLSIFRVSTGMHVSLVSRTPGVARRRATRLYGDLLNARALALGVDKAA